MRREGNTVFILTMRDWNLRNTDFRNGLDNCFYLNYEGLKQPKSIQCSSHNFGVFILTMRDWNKEKERINNGENLVFILTMRDWNFELVVSLTWHGTVFILTMRDWNSVKQRKLAMALSSFYLNYEGLKQTLERKRMGESNVFILTMRDWNMGMSSDL